MARWVNWIAATLFGPRQRRGVRAVRAVRLAGSLRPEAGSRKRRINDIILPNPPVMGVRRLARLFASCAGPLVSFVPLVLLPPVFLKSRKLLLSLLPNVRPLATLAP